MNGTTGSRVAAEGVGLGSVKPLGLRTRLLLLILLAFVPAFGLVLYSAYEQRQLQQAEIRAAMSVLARETAARHAQIIESTRHALLALSLLPAVRNANAAECSALFAELLPRYPHYLNLVAATPDGSIFCSARPMTQAVSVAKESSFTRALATGELALGEFSISNITGRPFIGEGYPVRDARGEVVAVIGAILSVDWLNQVAAKTALPAGVAFAVVDHAGNVVVRAPDAEKWVGRQVRDTAIFAARQRGEASIESIGLDGVTRIYGLATVQGVPPPGALYVSVGASTDEAFGPIRQALWRDLVLLGAAAGLALAIAWYGTRILVILPLLRLGKATRGVASGDLATRAAEGASSPELRDLTRDFNAMAERLQGDAEALRASEAKLRKLIDGLGASMFVGLLTPEGIVLEANQPALSAAGLEGADVRGKPVEHTYWFAYSTEVQQKLRAAIDRAAAGEPSRYDVQVQVAEGQYIWLDFSVQPLRDDAGRVAYLLPSAIVITERKQAEEAIKVSYSRQTELLRRLQETEESERRRINRELHDRIGQNLSMLLLNLGLLRDQMPPAALSAVGRRLDDAEKVLLDTTWQVRDLMAELHPPALDDFGVLAALRAFCNPLGARSGIEVEVSGSEPSPRLSRAVEMALFRVAEGALSNAIKHAKANRIDVTLGVSSGRVTLSVVDDGHGFNPGAGSGTPSWGLTIMRERAEAVGAALRVESSPGQGTRVVVEAIVEGTREAA